MLKLVRLHIPYNYMIKYLSFLSVCFICYCLPLTVYFNACISLIFYLTSDITALLFRLWYQKSLNHLLYFANRYVIIDLWQS